MKSGSHTVVAAVVLEKKQKKTLNKNKKTGFVRLKRWVQIYVPKLMASFHMKTEDNDCRRPIKSTLKSRWQNQSGAELLSC